MVFSSTLLKITRIKRLDFENCKCAAQFPFAQPQNAPVVPIPNTTPFIDFGLNLLATGRIEPTIRISVVIRPLNFSFFNRVLRAKITKGKVFFIDTVSNLSCSISGDTSVAV